ncbi:HAMP domain-containing histidine kinase [Qipengyuania sp. 1XM1-15A]|uniref:sensor histidine kinase n=1 Tax=Qipengyuania xiamenensis TaxID=2867237 RepID=UPI001C86B3B7|nr:HAMP domain-containing sensor histidine kinase [Qipengyuania xiamenensis]MBX7531529.1 HAMP domain-containing histidine kinase [Qipengyuania xiamenensis]
MSETIQTLTRARTDGEDCLIEAGEQLADLNRACGGEIGKTLAIPELLSLVVKARQYGLKLARQFKAIDGDKQVTAWAEITPSFGGDSGCEISIANWHVDDAPQDSAEEEIRRRTEINRHLAECSARLDPQQRVLSIETDADDLEQFAERVRNAVGKPWTDFVEFPGNAHAQPMHWRMLDGADCRIEGSRRSWSAHLEPLGKVDPGSAGFVLYLSASQPLAAVNASAGSRTPSLGRELTPVLRQPINRIIANAETIRTKLAGPLAEEYSDYAGDIASAGQHLLALIDDLSDLEVVEADDFSTAPDLIDLADVARRACGILGVRASERQIRLDPPAEGEMQMATAEFRRVLQVLLNLIGNAIRYAPEESRVWVRLDRVGERAMVTVADQGHGLDEEQQAKVFEKFERLGKQGDGGSGLGLYISRRIARAMGGDLTVESAKGQGARFTLSVPVAEADVPDA